MQLLSSSVGIEDKKMVSKLSVYEIERAEVGTLSIPGYFGILNKSG